MPSPAIGEREDPLPDGSREVTAEQLRHEALVCVYRILFCLYAEARGRELGILPISDDVYRLGYSLEALRDLADRGEPGTTAGNGTYYAQHLDRLFRLIHEGFHPEAAASGQQVPADRVEDVVSPRRAAMPHQHDLFGEVRPRQLSLGEGGRTAVEHGYGQGLRHPAPDRDPVRPRGHAASEAGSARQPGAAQGHPLPQPGHRRAWQTDRPHQLRGVGPSPARQRL